MIDEFMALRFLWLMMVRFVGLVLLCTYPLSSFFVATEYIHMQWLGTGHDTTNSLWTTAGVEFSIEWLDSSNAMSNSNTVCGFQPTFVPFTSGPRSPSTDVGRRWTASIQPRSTSWLPRTFCISCNLFSICRYIRSDVIIQLPFHTLTYSCTILPDQLSAPCMLCAYAKQRLSCMPERPRAVLGNTSSIWAWMLRSGNSVSTAKCTSAWMDFLDRRLRSLDLCGTRTKIEGAW